MTVASPRLQTPLPPISDRTLCFTPSTGSTAARRASCSSPAADTCTTGCGTGLPPRGTIDLPIARADDGSTRRIPAPGGQPSVTDYTVLAERDGCTLLRVAPRTGRTHQIRVHFAALGHPLLGDALYGGEMSRLTRPALHSAAADFAQPVTGQSLHITAPIPRDLRAFDFERYL